MFTSFNHHFIDRFGPFLSEQLVKCCIFCELHYYFTIIHCFTVDIVLFKFICFIDERFRSWFHLFYRSFHGFSLFSFFISFLYFYHFAIFVFIVLILISHLIFLIIRIWSFIFVFSSSFATTFSFTSLHSWFLMFTFSFTFFTFIFNKILAKLI